MSKRAAFCYGFMQGFCKVVVEAELCVHCLYV